MQSFHDWLRSADEAAAENLAMLIPSAGAAGISQRDIRRLVRLPLRHSTMC
jgi:hypothetical protein